MVPKQYAHIRPTLKKSNIFEKIYLTVILAINSIEEVINQNFGDLQLLEINEKLWEIQYNDDFRIIHRGPISLPHIYYFYCIDVVCALYPIFQNILIISILLYSQMNSDEPQSQVIEEMKQEPNQELQSDDEQEIHVQIYKPQKVIIDQEEWQWQWKESKYQDKRGWIIKKVTTNTEKQQAIKKVYLDESYRLSSKDIGSERSWNLIQGYWPALRQICIRMFGEERCSRFMMTQYPALQTIFLSCNNIKNLSFFSAKSLYTSEQINFPKLKKLYLGHNLIESIEPLCRIDAPILQTLRLEGNQITEITPLIKIKSQQLKVLILQQNYFYHICGLDHMAGKLQSLEINDQKNPKRTISIKPLIKKSFGRGEGSSGIWIMAQLEVSAQKSLTRKQRDISIH